MDERNWGGPERHAGKVEGRYMVRCVRYIPLGVQRVDKERVVLWQRVIIVLDKGKLGAAETAKVVDSSERALPKHVLKGDSVCERVKFSEHLPQLRRQFAN